MPELQLSFHASFALKKEDLLRIIKVALEDKGVEDTRDNLVARTGMGAPKVGAFKTWAIRCGLVDRSTGKLIPQGSIVLAHDPYLESPVTDWLIHFSLRLPNVKFRNQPKAT